MYKDSKKLQTIIEDADWLAWDDDDPELAGILEELSNNKDEGEDKDD